MAVDEPRQQSPAGKIHIADAGRRAARGFAGADRNDRSPLGDQVAVRDMAVTVNDPAIKIDGSFRCWRHARLASHLVM